jgi:hypothetical protein
MLRDQRNGLLHDRADRNVRGGEDAAIGLRRQGDDGALDIGKSVDGGNDRLHAKRRGGALERAHVQGRAHIVRIIEHGDARDAGRKLLKRLQHLPDDREL